MILNRRINLIWYGRGNVQGGCDSFALHGNAVASAAISDVYCVTEGSGNTTFEENTWKASKPSQAVGFTKLECGNLYVVVLNDGQTIDIPEAVVVYGGESVNPANIVSVLPDNDGGTEPEPETEPTGDCTPDNLYTNASIAAGEITINGANYAINTQIGSMNVSNDVTFSYRGSLTVGDTGSGVNFLFNGGQLLQINGIASLTFDHPLYIEFRNLTVTDDGTTKDFSGCYKSTSASGTETNIAIELVSDEVDERTPTPSPSHTVTPDVSVDAQATCFADNESAEYRMVYEAPAEATPASEVTTANVKVYKKGNAAALTDAESNPSDEGAVVLKNAMITKAIDQEEGSSSKHSFCIWFDVTIHENNIGTNDPVYLKALGNTDGINADDTNFNLQATSPEQLASDSSGQTNVKFNLVGSPKIWVESSDTCVTTSVGEDNISTFNF